MEHSEAGEGEFPQHFVFGCSIEEIDNATAYQQYDMHGGSNSAGTQECHLTSVESQMASPMSAPMSGKKHGSAKRVSHRGSAFTKDEDCVLCLAFLNVSKDPITGVNQNMDGYYKRIYDYYQARKPEGSIRSQISLQKRWSIIQKAVTKFCSFKTAVDRRNESGRNEYDSKIFVVYMLLSLLVSINSWSIYLLTYINFKFQIDDAVKMYEKSELFHFMHCWKMLCDEAKWNDKFLELTTTPNVAKVATAAASSPQNVNDNVPVERPEGRDSAKRRRSREDTASSNAAIEVLQQIHDRNKNAEGKQDQ